MKTSRLFITLMTSFGTLLAISAASSDCSAQDSDVYLISDGDFNSAANWSNGLAPSLTIIPPKTVPNIYGIDDGLSATFSGGTTTIRGLRVGSGAKEHPNSETQFGRLTMTGGSLEVIGSAANGLFGVGRERENDRIGADYNKNAVVDAADYAIWRDTFGSTSDLRADGDGNGTIEQADYDFWKARFGKVVKGGEIIMTGTSTLTANGVIIGERTTGLLAVGPNAVVELRTWVSIDEPPHFGGTEDMRVGGYGPAYDDFGTEPGLDGRGLVDVQGTLNAKDVYLSEHGAKGEIRLSGGSVTLNGALIMDLCANCQTDPALLALRSAKVSIVGSSGTFNVGLDPDPLVIDPTPPNRDILAATPTASFSFTADAGGLTPITIVENVGEASGTANIEGATLELNLDAYTSTSPLTLINAPAGQLLGQFGTVTFLGNTTATVNYDVFNGNVFLNNFQITSAAASLVGSVVPEPSGLATITLALSLLLSSLRERNGRRTIFRDSSG